MPLGIFLLSVPFQIKVLSFNKINVPQRKYLKNNKRAVLYQLSSIQGGKMKEMIKSIEGKLQFNFLRNCPLPKPRTYPESYPLRDVFLELHFLGGEDSEKPPRHILLDYLGVMKSCFFRVVFGIGRVKLTTGYIW